MTTRELWKRAWRMYESSEIGSTDELIAMRVQYLINHSHSIESIQDIILKEFAGNAEDANNNAGAIGHLFA